MKLIEFNHSLELNRLKDDFDISKLKNFILQKIVPLVNGNVANTIMKTPPPEEEAKQKPAATTAAPIYLGVFADYEKAKPKVQALLTEVIERLLEKFPSDLDMQLL